MENTEEKNPVGRPTKWQDSFVDKVLEYFTRKPYEEKVYTATDSKGNEIVKVMQVPCDFPTLAGFACEIGVTRETVHEWSTQRYPEDYENKDLAGKLVHEEFSYAIKRGKAYQESILVTNGMKGLYEQPFAIFGAKNILGWRDKTDIDHTTKGESLAGANEVAKALRALYSKEGEDKNGITPIEPGNDSGDTDVS